MSAVPIPPPPPSNVVPFRPPPPPSNVVPFRPPPPPNNVIPFPKPPPPPPVPRDLLDSLLDYLRQQYAERKDLWAHNLLVHFQEIRDP